FETVSGLKMQWTPEHTQWAEQHFDISSTTRSPAHKVEAYRGHLQRTYQYAWANDDISALTASNLLKKYAEKYSGILEGPNERALLCSYSDSTVGLMNGRKSENESWQEGIYPMNCAPDVISVSKAGMTAALPPTDVSASIGSSPGVASSLSEPSYSSSNCGSHTATTLHSGLSSQTSVGPGYSPGGAPPASAYLPSGIAAPTPIPPSTLPGYTYQSHNHTPIAPTPLNGSTSNSLKRKAFYMSGHGDMDSSYANFNYNQQRSSQSPMYRIADSVSDSNRGNGFDRNAEASSLAFKPTKQPMSSEQQRKFILHSGRALTPPSYGSTKSSVGDLRTEPYSKFGSPVMSEQTEEHRQHLSHSLTGPDIGAATSSIHAAEEQLKSSDSNLVEMVTTEILQQGPPVDWSDIVGLDVAKAAIKEEILWPILRPDMFSGLTTLPRSLLLFGPQGTGRTLLAHCMASQLGAAFLQLSSSALVTKWLGEGDKIIQASFLVARCRQPAVVFIKEVDLLLSDQLSEESPVNRLKAELLMQLDSILTSAEDHVLVVCSTNKPEEIPESLRRYFAKRLLIPLPDGTARHQIITQLLSQHNYCLSDKEMSLLVQRTEGFSGLDVAQLCQQAAVGPLHGIPGTDLSALHPTQMRPVSYQDFDSVFCKFQPSISQKELDVYTEWNKMFGCSQ
uniref:Fidgetin n=1 Tax=Gasterosteus aculeatus TaxID=69293 RepID=G3NPJ7_GASAC